MSFFRSILPLTLLSKFMHVYVWEILFTVRIKLLANFYQDSNGFLWFLKT